MPYVLHKFSNGKYKVGLKDKVKMSNGKKYLSNKYLTKEEAIKQKKAVEISESKKKKNYKSK